MSQPATVALSLPTTVEIKKHELNLLIEGVENGEIYYQYDSEYPGASIIIDGHYLAFYADPWDESNSIQMITLSDVRKAGAEAILSDDFDQRHGEYLIQHNDIREDIRDHIYDLVRQSANEYYWEAAECATEFILNEYEDATDFIKYSPRGFGNEVYIYAVKERELEAAKDWITANISESGWFRVLKTDKLNILLRDSWHAHLKAREESLYKQHVISIKIDSWWTDERSATA